MFTIRKLSQSFVIHDPPSGVVRYLELMVNSQLKAPKLKRERGKIFVEDGDHYYFVDLGRNDHYYSNAHFDLVLQAIEMAKSTTLVDKYEIIEYEPEKRKSVDVKYKGYGFDLLVPEDNPDIFEFYGWQNEVSQEAVKPERLQTIFEVQTGRGKSLLNSEPIKTPHGDVLMGKIKVGDKVIGSDGKSTDVIGVYPQGELQLYELETYDGRKVKVCGEHLWQSFYVNTTKKRQWGIRNTLELKRLLGMHNPRVYLPLPKPIDYSELKVKPLIHPYVLGALIGDGSLSPTITFTKYDIPVLDKMNKHLHKDIKFVPSNYQRTDRSLFWSLSGDKRAIKMFKDFLDGYGLMGKRAWEKFIPEVYKYASIEDRWELLRGLMDTDGTVNKDGGQPSYTTTSKVLAEEVTDLARSLGGIAKLSSRIPTYTNKGEKLKGRRAYTVFMRFPKPSDLFHLPRKKELTRDNGQYNDILKLRVKSITECGKGEATCIKVSAKDELFVTGDHIVTHNTKTFQKSQVRLGKRTLIITKSGYVPKWREDSCDSGGLNEVPGRVRVVTGVAGMEALFTDAEEGELDRKKISTIVVGTKTLKMWLGERSNGGVPTRFPLYEFYDRLGVGFVGYDEIHEHFHSIYLAGIVLNPPKTVEMSATLKPGNSKDFLKRRYLERFPLHNRINIPYFKVVKTAFYYYSITNRHLTNKINNLKMYSHNDFENMIYKCGMRDEYFDMVYELLVKSFFNKYEKGQRALVFFSLIQTCTDFTEYLKKRMVEDSQPNLKVVRYTGTDKYADLMDSEIAISTPGKAGTAVDLPKLTVALITTAIDDRQLNEQMAGRPRKLKDWPDRDPLVIYTHCSEIVKHHKYLEGRRNTLTPIVISVDVIHSDYRLQGVNPYANGGGGNKRKFNPARTSDKINRYRKGNHNRNFNPNKFRPNKSKKKWKKKGRSTFNRWR